MSAPCHGVQAGARGEEHASQLVGHCAGRGLDTGGVGLQSVCHRPDSDFICAGSAGPLSQLLSFSAFGCAALLLLEAFEPWSGMLPS